MKDVRIKLNFFALENQDIHFKIYRQDYADQPQQDGYYRKQLPKTPDSADPYSQYLVTLNATAEFEEFTCKASDNPYLTIDILWKALKSNIKRNINENDYVLSERGFNRYASIVVGRHVEGNEVVNIEPYNLKACKRFGFLIDFRFRKHDEVPFSKKVQQLSLSLDKNFNSNTNYYSDKYDKLINFLKKFNQKLFPLTIDGINYGLQHDLFPMSPDYLESKSYIFANTKPSNSQFNGLKENGPYKAIDKPPLFIYIFQDPQKDLANDIFKALTGMAFPSIFSGMEKMFGVKMTKENVTKINFKSFSKGDLEEIESELTAIKRNSTGKQIIGLFVEHTKEYFSQTEVSPYYFLKFIFTKQHIPLQAITIERIKGKNGLKWLASGLGLQIFAKMGGVPWKVRPSNDNCLIFGLGSAHKFDDNGNIKKYIAYSVCMDSSGIYKKLDVLSEDDKEESYIAKLKENIKTVLQNSIGDNITKCAIHLPFKIKRIEIKSIREGINEAYPDEQKIEFVFIKVNTDNKYFGYAENNSKVPYEGSYLKLSWADYLVWFEGLQFGRENIVRRISNPVHIAFLEDTIDDEKRKKYLQDIINLSGANWRGFNARLSPISILYPEIIANYLAEFRAFNGDNDIDISSIPFPWFL